MAVIWRSPFLREMAKLEAMKCMSIAVKGKIADAVIHRLQ
jgi:hypothetical protein